MLLAGASGSGKSRLVRRAGCPELALDDFYFDAGEPGLPRLAATHAAGANAIDWDDVGSWDAAAALRTMIMLCRDGYADVPSYDIGRSARTGWHRLDLDGHTGFVAEGIFGPDMITACRRAGLRVQPVYLDRPRTLTMIMRFVRDLREHRKPPLVLMRRGLALWRAEPAFRARAVSAGCRPMSMRQATEVISTWTSR